LIEHVCFKHFKPDRHSGMQLEAALHAQQASLEATDAKNIAKNECPTIGGSLSVVGKPSGGVHDEATSCAARAVISDIRRRNLFDVDVPPEMAPSIAEYRAMCGRALEKLGNDVYSKEGRFWFELLQNCDDNTYPPGVDPCVRLIVEPDNVYLINNESGFVEKDVRALCNLGASTKVASNAIGRKGIGFKSVFMISDLPHIVSNHWSFRFDVITNGLFGYVIPEWVERDTIIAKFPREAQAALEADIPTTCMWLPRNRPLDLNINETFVPETLLFLRKIKLVQIEEHGFNRTVRIEHIDLEAIAADQVATSWGSATMSSVSMYDTSAVETAVVGETTAADSDGCDSGGGDGGHDGRGGFAVPSDPLPIVHRVYRRSNIPIPPYLGTGTSEIALSIPETAPLKQGHIFAFLPVCRAGFPFEIHSNWDLTSSREDVKHVHPLNLWIRDQIAPTLIAALETCPALKQRLGDILNHTSVVDEFWQPVVRQIVQGWCKIFLFFIF
jgi:hypothetical protein